MWNTVSVIRLSTVDCCSTGENKEVVRDMGRKRESNSCLRRSSEVLGPSSPGAAVQDTNLVVRDNLERRASFEGNLAPLSAGEQDNLLVKMSDRETLTAKLREEIRGVYPSFYSPSVMIQP